MLYLILWYFYAFGGAYCNTCETLSSGSCQEYLYTANVFSIAGFPDLEQIEHFCPSILTYLDCLEKYENECDFDDFGLFATEKEFHKVKDFMTDICNVNSSLYKKYLENVECFVSLNENMTDCIRAGESIYLKYAEYKRNHIPERDEPYTTPNNILCVSKSYNIMCAILKTLSHCGLQAFNFSRELINRSNLLPIFCRKMELYDIQTSFLDFLGYEDKLKEKLTPIFSS